jgi:hypothetical protein
MQATVIFLDCPGRLLKRASAGVEESLWCAIVRYPTWTSAVRPCEERIDSGRCRAHFARRPARQPVRIIVLEEELV